MPLDDAVVGGESRRPRSSPSLRRALGGSDDVGEQHRRQHAVRRRGAALAGEERLDLVQHPSASPANQHAVAVELDEPRVRDPLGDVRVRDRRARSGPHAGASAASAPECCRAPGGRRCAGTVEHRRASTRGRRRGVPPRPPAPLAHRPPPSSAPARRRAHRSRRAPKPSTYSRASLRDSRTAGRRRGGSARTGSTARVSARGGDGSRRAA